MFFHDSDLGVGLERCLDCLGRRAGGPCHFLLGLVEVFLLEAGQILDIIVADRT